MGLPHPPGSPITLPAATASRGNCGDPVPQCEAMLAAEHTAASPPGAIRGQASRVTMRSRHPTRSNPGGTADRLAASLKPRQFSSELSSQGGQHRSLDRTERFTPSL
jgi:hypothetical protein